MSKSTALLSVKFKFADSSLTWFIVAKLFFPHLNTQIPMISSGGSGAPRHLTTGIVSRKSPSRATPWRNYDGSRTYNVSRFKNNIHFKVHNITIHWMKLKIPCHNHDWNQCLGHCCHKSLSGSCERTTGPGLSLLIVQNVLTILNRELHLVKLSIVDSKSQFVSIFNFNSNDNTWFGLGKYFHLEVTNIHLDVILSNDDIYHSTVLHRTAMSPSQGDI